jgi:hypothetical protein
MTFGIRLIALAGLVAGLAIAGPAAARAKHHHHARRHVAHVTRCSAGLQQFSWSFLWSTGPAPQWNGCAPPVYDNGEFIGQDPDANVRATLRRDPDEGYRPRH